jgi:ketosteroid isomerase-like protein
MDYGDGSAAVVRHLVLDHIEAFNRHDTPRLLAGLTDDVRWVTGEEALHGQRALAGLFTAELWALQPHLRVRSLLVDGTSAAAQLREELTVDGVRRTYEIAVFFRIRDGRIAAAKVYREGSAVIE